MFSIKSTPVTRSFRILRIDFGEKGTSSKLYIHLKIFNVFDEFFFVMSKYFVAHRIPVPSGMFNFELFKTFANAGFLRASRRNSGFGVAIYDWFLLLAYSKAFFVASPSVTLSNLIPNISNVSCI